MTQKGMPTLRLEVAALEMKTSKGEKDCDNSNGSFELF